MRTKFGLFILLLAVFWQMAQEFSFEKAKRVDDFLARIAGKSTRSIFFKKVTFSEDELNAYLNLIYLKKYVPEVPFINLVLREKNQVNGRLKVKLSDRKYDSVPSFLRDVEVKFSGLMECENYRLRFIFKDLFLNNTRFSPEVIDEVYGVAQAGRKIKQSIYDWFALLPGLKNINTGYRTITLFY